MLPLVYHSTFCQSSSHFFSCLQQERKGKREIKSGKILCSFDLNRKHYCFVLPVFSSLMTMMTANIIFHKRLEYFYNLFLFIAIHLCFPPFTRGYSQITSRFRGEGGWRICNNPKKNFFCCWKNLWQGRRVENVIFWVT